MGKRPFLAICVPSIRQELVCDLYDSLEKYTQVDWCFSVISPYGIPDRLKRKSNVVWNQSYRSPAACQAMAVEQCNSDFITYLADDSVVNLSWGEFTSKPSLSDSWKKTHVAFYSEGGNSQLDSYFRINNALPRSPHIPDSFYCFNVGIINREYYHYLGGFDCSFETSFFTHTSLGLAAQFNGSEVEVFGKDVAVAQHFPGESFDHGPIHHQHYQDQYLYEQRFCLQTPCFSRENMLHWSKTPEIWKRRFS